MFKKLLKIFIVIPGPQYCFLWFITTGDTLEVTKSNPKLPSFKKIESSSCFIKQGIFYIQLLILS